MMDLRKENFKSLKAPLHHLKMSLKSEKLMK